jgi:anti-anti-sigma regulatory factor
MNINPSTTLERVIAADLPVELVRGEEQPFLDRILPLVLSSSVAVDLSGVRRIDAAGIGALITLYREARAAGRVARLLRRVGLDRLLEGPIAAAPVPVRLADAAA